MFSKYRERQKDSASQLQTTTAPQMEELVIARETTIPLDLEHFPMITVPLKDITEKEQGIYDSLYLQFQHEQDLFQNAVTQEQKLIHFREAERIAALTDRLLAPSQWSHLDEETVERLRAKTPEEMEAVIGIPREMPPELAPSRTKTKKEKKEEGRVANQFYKASKEAFKKNEAFPPSREEFARFQQSDWAKKNVFSQKVKGIGTQKDLFDMVRAGNYADFERLDNVLRNGLAMEYMQTKFKENHLRGESMDEFINRLTVQEGIGGLMHPLMRLGISLYMKQPGGLEGTNYTSPQTFKELDMKINTRIMVETVVHKPAGEQLEKLRRSYPAGPEGEAQCQEALTRNKQSRKFVAKMLLMTQLSDFKRMEKAGGAIVPHDWDSHISAAYTHCSRVGFILPKEADSIRQQRMLDSFLGARDGLDAGFASRFSATHALKRKSAEPGGREFKEQKMKFGWYTGQSGMNIAVGGLGNTGIAGAPGEERLLRNDGSCGHLYMHLDKGNERYHTGLLLGFESDAFKKKNQLGHTHGLGNPEYASSFGGLRTDEIGEKYGGRQADLTKFSPEMLERIMDSFDAYLERELDAEDTGDLTELVKKLAGQKMNRENMQELFTKIQVLNPDDILSLIP